MLNVINERTAIHFKAMSIIAYGLLCLAAAVGLLFVIQSLVTSRPTVNWNTWYCTAGVYIAGVALLIATYIFIIRCIKGDYNASAEVSFFVFMSMMGFAAVVLAWVLVPLALSCWLLLDFGLRPLLGKIDAKTEAAVLVFPTPVLIDPITLQTSTVPTSVHEWGQYENNYDPDYDTPEDAGLSNATISAALSGIFTNPNAGGIAAVHTPQQVATGVAHQTVPVIQPGAIVATKLMLPHPRNYVGKELKSEPEVETVKGPLLKDGLQEWDE